MNFTISTEVIGDLNNRKEEEAQLVKPVLGEKAGLILEIAWTIIPALVLVGVAIPSFVLLYTAEELIDPTVTVKVEGYQ